VVRRLLNEDPSCSGTIKDLADDPRYLAWAAAAS
jgi:hypothetical protein